MALNNLLEEEGEFRLFLDPEQHHWARQSVWWSIKATAKEQDM